MIESGPLYNKGIFGLTLRIIVLRPRRKKSESLPRGHETPRRRVLRSIPAWDGWGRLSSSYSLHSLLRRLAGVLMALVFCRAIFAQQPDPRQIFDAALAAQRRGDETLAVSKYTQVIHLHPDLTAEPRTPIWQARLWHWAGLTRRLPNTARRSLRFPPAAHSAFQGL